MAPIPEDLPRRDFPDAASFLAAVRDLIAQGRWVWRPKHMLAHTVSEMEAVNFLRLAGEHRAERDRKWLGRWRVQGPYFGRIVGVSVSVWMSPTGDKVYFASAFTPKDV